MKEIVFNKERILDEDIEVKETRVKVLLHNSANEILLCKINEVYHFVGGHPKSNETFQECAKRELEEETGINVKSSLFNPFLQLKEYKSNYFNTGKKGMSTIIYVECQTDNKFDYNNRNLDDEEAKKDFKLEYVDSDNIKSELEKNREVARNKNKEFIIIEMIYVISEYERQIKEKQIYKCKERECYFER